MPIKNKITKIIILGLIVVIAYALYPHSAYAGSCSWTDWNGYDCVNSILANITYAVLVIVSKITYLAGLFFDLAVGFALGPTAKDIFTAPTSVVITGWQTVRDIANMFFLFALLYIGISIILQLTSYGTKKILLGVIIAALLVNFSLPITRVIIDFSNVMAMEFLCKMSGGSCDAKDLSGVIVNGISMQTLFGETGAAAVQPKEKELNLTKVMIAGAMGTVVLLITAFVLFAGGVLFLGRTVILMILTILSPLAFLFMALPGKASSYANQWWDYLFKQCFFAPVYLFFLYLVISMIAPTAGGGPSRIQTMTGSTGGSFADLATNDGTIKSSSAGLMLQFVIIIILLLMCLISAQQLGAYGASGMIKLGQKAKSKTIGYAGRGARRATGRVAERFATGEGISKEEMKGRWWGARAAATLGRGVAATGKGVRKIPLAGRWTTEGAADIAAANRAKVAEMQQSLAKNNAAELKSIAAASSGFKRTAAINQLAKLEKLTPGQGLSSEHIKATPNYLKRYGMDKEAKDIEKLNWQYAETDEERKEIVEKASPAVMRKIMEDEGLSSQYLKTPGMINKMQESLLPQHYKAIYEANTEASHKFFGSMTEGIKGIGELAQKLEGLGTDNSRRSATWATSTSAGAIMETYLPPQPEKKEPPKESPKEGTREYADEQWKRTSKK